MSSYLSVTHDCLLHIAPGHSYMPGHGLSLHKTDYAENNYWVFGLVLNDDVKFNAKEAMQKLADKGIGCRPFFYPLNEQPVFKKLGISDDIKRPVSARLYERGFYIPSGLGLSDADMDRVVKEVRSLF